MVFVPYKIESFLGGKPSGEPIHHFIPEGVDRLKITFKEGERVIEIDPQTLSVKVTSAEAEHHEGE
jgi:hypothetical protein